MPHLLSKHNINNLIIPISSLHFNTQSDYAIQCRFCINVLFFCMCFSLVLFISYLIYPFTSSGVGAFKHLLDFPNDFPGLPFGSDRRGKKEHLVEHCEAPWIFGPVL